MPDLFSLVDLRLYMHRELAQWDDQVGVRARSRATNYLRVELGVEFDELARTLTERIPATTTYLRLPGPLVSVQAVSVGDTPLTDYSVTKRGVQRARGFGSGAAGDWCTVQVDYTAGFAVIPSDLADWGMHLGSLAYGRGSQGGAIQTSVSADGVSETVQYEAAAEDGDTDPVLLPERVLRGLRHRYGSGRPRTGTKTLRAS